MILLWVMSILMYLSWAVTQLEHSLSLEIKTMAVYQSQMELFQKTENHLLLCEQSLLANAPLRDCRIELIAVQAPNKTKQGKVKLDHTKRYQVRVGDRVRLQSTVLHDLERGTIQRINWQQLYE